MPVVRLERFTDERIAVITLDRPPLNAIDEQVVTELDAATTELAADAETRAVLVRSALDGVFMAGADIHEFERIAAEGIDRALLAQEVFTRFAELPQPTVAAINGHALGGGLELALACDFRFLGRAEGAARAAGGAARPPAGRGRHAAADEARGARPRDRADHEGAPALARAGGRGRARPLPRRARRSSRRRRVTTPFASPARRRSRCGESSARSAPRGRPTASPSRATRSGRCSARRTLRPA